MQAKNNFFDFSCGDQELNIGFNDDFNNNFDSDLFAQNLSNLDDCDLEIIEENLKSAIERDHVAYQLVPQENQENLWKIYMYPDNSEGYYQGLYMFFAEIGFIELIEINL